MNFIEISNSSASSRTRTDTPFQARDFKSRMYYQFHHRGMAVWVRVELTMLRVKVIYGYQFHHQTMLRYLWRESNSQFKLVLNQLCLPVAPHRHGCPEMTRTSILWARTTRATFAPQDNFRYSQRESNPYFNFEKVTT